MAETTRSLCGETLLILKESHRAGEGAWAPREAAEGPRVVGGLPCFHEARHTQKGITLKTPAAADPLAAKMGSFCQACARAARTDHQSRAV
jgi:hypothetical protein